MKRVCSLAFLIIVTILAIMFANLSISKKEQSYTTQDERGTGVYNWLHAFCNQQFDICDTVAENDFQLLDYTSPSSILSYKVYLSLLIHLSNSIDNAEIIESKRDSTGYRTVNIQVSNTPYLIISDIDFNRSEFVRILNTYSSVRGDSDNELTTSLMNFYLNIFNTCFTPTSDHSTSIVLSLKEGKEGNVCDVKPFINMLLRVTNTESILKVYEDCIQSETESILNAGINPQ